MKLNILKFQTKKGTRLIFDNYSGIVIEEKENTEYILKHIDEDKYKIADELKEMGIYKEDEFESSYHYLSSLVSNGYFNDKKRNRADRVSKDNFYNGLSSNLILITTEECNLRCKYCVYSDSYADKKTYSSKIMKKETAKRAMDLFFELHQEKVKRGYKDEPKINFYGGEPLLNFELVKETVAYARQIGMDQAEFLITTNGTVMNDEIIDFLAKNNFLVSFSLDGNEFNHNRNRVNVEGKPTHQTVFKNIIKYHDRLKLYKRNSVINITCCFDDYTDMIRVTDFFEEMSSRVDNLNVIYNKIYEIDTSYYDDCEERYKNNADISKNTYSESVNHLFQKYYIEEKNKEIPKSVKSIFTSYYIIKNRKKGILDFHQGNACIIGDKICVSPDENIYICEKANQEVNIGNLKDGLDFDKINTIYNKYFSIRDQHCAECPINRLCDVCYVHFIKNNEIQHNESFCAKRKEVLIRGLEVVYSLMEEDKDIFNYE